MNPISHCLVLQLSRRLGAGAQQYTPLLLNLSPGTSLEQQQPQQPPQQQQQQLPQRLSPRLEDATPAAAGAACSSGPSAAGRVLEPGTSDSGAETVRLPAGSPASLIWHCHEQAAECSSLSACRPSPGPAHPGKHHQRSSQRSLRLWGA